MKRSQVVNDIINDIEFEITQGIVSQGELGQGIEEVQRFQNKARIETFEKIKVTDRYRQVLGQIYQINDMQTTLLNEMGLALQSMQLKLQKLSDKPDLFLPQKTYPGSQEAEDLLSSTEIDEDFILEIPPADELKNSIKSNAIQLEMQVRPVKIPFIGKLLTKLKILYQRPALFYCRLLASKQITVNQVLGERILQLESLIKFQQQQIVELRSRLLCEDE
jgi:hypothetical protein